MDKFHSSFEWVHWLNKKVGSLIGYSIPVLALLIMFEIVMRYVFNRPTTWVHDISQFIFGAGYMLGAGYTLLVDGHANMDMVYGRFTRRGKAVLDIATGLLFLLYVTILIWKTGIMAWDSIVYREVLTQSSFEPPLYPIKIILFIGCVLLALQGLSKFIKDIEIAIFRKERKS